MIGILGGSFDPIHNGHLRMAIEVCNRVTLSQIRFIPCHHHALQKPLHATVTQRLAMLELAIAKQTQFLVDDREIQRNTKSYTIDTLISLQQDFKNEKLALIIGSDAFLQFPQWHQWQALLNYAHIIVLRRKEQNFFENELITDYIKQYRLIDINTLQQQNTHKICLLEPPILGISSSYIRECLQNKKSIEYLMPDTVIDYIIGNKIYME